LRTCLIARISTNLSSLQNVIELSELERIAV